jgi:hypothetical protein
MREMRVRNLKSLRPGLLWLTLNLALIIQCLFRNNLFLNFAYPVRRFLVPPKMSSHTPGVRVPQVEDHSTRPFGLFQFQDLNESFQPTVPCLSAILSVV